MSSSRVNAAVAWALLFLTWACGGAAHAIDAYWCGPRSDLWHDGIAGGTSNWFSLPPTDPSAVVRSVPDGTARFAPGAVRTNLRIAQDASIGRMSFTPDAPLYTFRILRERQFFLTGAGVVNQSSAVTPRFTVLALARMGLTGSAKLASVGARSAHITTADQGELTFEGTAAGGDAEVFNTSRGATSFSNSSSAERMTITNSNRGALYFYDTSTGDRATVINKPSGVLAVGSRDDLPIGRVDNSGEVRLADTKLMVARTYFQSNNGSLELFVNNARNFGGIVAQKGVRLGGTLDILLSRDVVAGFIRIIVSRGAMVGKFATLKVWGSGAKKFNASLVYAGREVRLVLAPK